MINNSVLVGRLTADPDLKYTASGDAVSSFRLAVNRNFKNGQGEYEADFINCVIGRLNAERKALSKLVERRLDIGQISSKLKFWRVKRNEKNQVSG